MSELNIEIDKSLFSPKFLPYLADYSHRTEIYMGSAGSGKSYFITQKLLFRALNTHMKVMVCRRYGSTLRNSVFSLWKDLIKQWKLTKFCKINESNMIIKLFNGSEIIFIGLDSEEKLLSLNGITAVHIEEVYECPKDIVEQIQLRLRGKGSKKQIIMSFNPISKNHWLYEYVERERENENTLYLHSTYKDNPFLDEDYVKQLERLYITNPQKARVFCDGQWGVNNDALVLKNWTIEDFDVNELLQDKLIDVRQGLDFGFNDPTAIVRSLYDKKQNIIYVYDEFYKRGQTLDQIVQAVNDLHIGKGILHCDSNEPRTVDYLKSKRINAVNAMKGKDSVKLGILFLQNCKIIVKPCCENFIMELENFSYILDKKTNEYKDDEYTHEFSHAIDACRYSYSNIYMNKRVTTLDKSILGL